MRKQAEHQRSSLSASGMRIQCVHLPRVPAATDGLYYVKISFFSFKLLLCGILLHQ